MTSVDGQRSSTVMFKTNKMESVICVRLDFGTMEELVTSAFLMDVSIVSQPQTKKCFGNHVSYVRRVMLLFTIITLETLTCHKDNVSLRMIMITIDEHSTVWCQTMDPRVDVKSVCKDSI